MQPGRSLQYRFAKGNDNNVVDVLSLTPESRHDRAPYECYGCGSELIPNLGTKKVYHFSHRPNQNCSGETYLHKLAKTVFFQTYSECLRTSRPFSLSFVRELVCTRYREEFGFDCRTKERTDFDLTSRFTRIEMEKGYRGVIPDILLSTEDGRETMFVEIAVSHRCEPEKIALGERILEISISREDQINPILDRMIELDRSPDFRTHNFKWKVDERDHCKGGCQSTVGAFMVMPSQKCILRTGTPREISAALAGSAGYSKNLGPRKWTEERGRLFIKEVQSAFFDSGVALKNCYICKYHGSTEDGGGVFCKHLKEHHESNFAAECKAFRPFASADEWAEADRKNRAYAKRTRAYRRSQWI